MPSPKIPVLAQTPRERYTDRMAAPHNDNIKEKILQSATALLRERPFAEISLSDVARLAGVTKGSVYYYYKTKDDLLYDVADGYLNILYRDLIAWVDNENKDTSFPRLLRYALLRGVDDPGKSLRLHLTMDAIAGNEQLRQKLLARYDAFRRVIAEKCAARKPAADGDYYAWLILTLVDGLLIQSLLGDPAIDIPTFIEETVQTLG